MMLLLTNLSGFEVCYHTAIIVPGAPTTTTGDPDIATRLAYLEGRMHEQTALLRQIVAQLEQINGRMDRVDERVDQVNSRIDAVNSRINEVAKEVNARIDRLYLTTFGIGGGIIAGLVGVILTLVLQG